MHLKSIFYKNVFLGVLIFISNYSFAAEITGHVYDGKSLEQLISATIRIQPSNQRTTSSVSGSFSFKDLKEGTYKLSISYIGYAGFDTTIIIAENQKIKFDCYLFKVTRKLDEVLLVAKAGEGTDEFAKRREQRSTNIMNIVSANTIAISPDITVANVMQRISGVSVERSNSGDGQYAIIRGMDKRYNTTLVNGIKIPSPDNRNRYVPLDIFPADLVERIEVIKSLTPDMEADAAGGVINLVMKNAPDKLKIDGNAGTGYSHIFLNRDFSSFSRATVNLSSPAEISGQGVFAPIAAFPYNNLITTAGKSSVNKNFGLTLGDRFFQNKLGVIFSGSYQNAYRGSNSNVLLQSNTVPAAPDNTTAQQPAFSDIYYREYNSKIDRSGVEAKLDYNFNTDHSLSLFTTYLQMNERRVRLTSDSLLGGYVRANNYIGPYAIYRNTETRSDLQNIFNITLQGRNKLYNKLNADWSLVASEAKRQLPDIAEFQIGYPVAANTTVGTFTIGEGQTEKESREWIHNTDKDLAGYLNLHYKKVIAGHKAEFGLGGMYRHKERDNYANTYNLTPVSDKDSVYQKFVSIQASTFTFIPSNGSLGNAIQSPGVYHAFENVAAVYGQAKYNFTKRLEAIGGVRIETTLQNYTSSLPAALPGKTGNFTYIDLLPSIQIKYSLSDKKAIRFSYFRSIFRPSFADLIPFPDKSGTSDNYLVEGNPYLNHTVIDNLDLRYEIFPKGLDQYMIGAFYKIITNPIEYAFSNGSGTSSYSATPIYSPQNIGTAHNFGIELVFRKYFGNFGIAGNYTYTNSEINASKLYVYLSPNGATNFTTVADRRPLQGQSEHIGNFSLLYKNTRNKIDAQLALVYTGTRINTLSQYKGFDNWEKATTNLDFSIQKEFGHHYILYVKANNLLNTPYQLILKQHNNAYNSKTLLPFQESIDYLTVQYDKFYASYSLGFRFKF